MSENRESVKARCPKCGDVQTMTQNEKGELPNCGNCLMNRVEMVRYVEVTR